jgi:hypothetical protein
LPSPIVIDKSHTALTLGDSRVQIPILLQPGGRGAREQKSILTDNEEVIASVKNERWRLSRNLQKALENNYKNATKCEEARDGVLEWCIQHNPRSNMEAWRAEAASAKAVAELLHTITRGATKVCDNRDLSQCKTRWLKVISYDRGPRCTTCSDSQRPSRGN